MKLAVHLHLYYQEQLSSIIAYLRSLNGVDYDLYVTMTEQSDDSLQQIKSFKPDAIILKVDNRGYDIGPFIEFLNHINLDSYDYILKLHTKGQQKECYTKINLCRLNNALWHNILFSALLKSPDTVAKNFKILKDNPKIGMLGAAYCLTDEPRLYGHMLSQINAELQTMGFKPCTRLSFIAGTMFLTRASLLKPLQKYKISDFMPTDGKIKEGTKAHIFERLFGAVIAAQGCEIFGIKQCTSKLQLIFIAISRFFYQKKHTKNGKTLIKICKIPVYSNITRGRK